MININAGDRVVRKKDGLEYIIIYIGYNNKEWYLILEDYNNKNKKSTCEYSFNLEKDYELIKTDKIEQLNVTAIKCGLGMKVIGFECLSDKDLLWLLTCKINEIIEYINKEEK